jgi:hypothetical protein
MMSSGIDGQGNAENDAVLQIRLPRFHANFKLTKGTRARRIHNQGLRTLEVGIIAQLLFAHQPAQQLRERC